MSPNHGATMVSTELCLHYTASTNYESTIRALCAPAWKASAHLVIDFDGSITQLVPFHLQAWHAGKSHWDGRDNCNRFMIGFEIMNPGYLTVQDGKYFDHAKQLWKGGVFIGRHKNTALKFAHWATYPREQMDAVEEAARTVIREYGLRDVVGHDDISAGRKFDPGPAFDMDAFRGATMTGEALDARDNLLPEPPNV